MFLKKNEGTNDFLGYFVTLNLFCKTNSFLYVCVKLQDSGPCKADFRNQDWVGYSPLSLITGLCNKDSNEVRLRDEMILPK